MPGNFSPCRAELQFGNGTYPFQLKLKQIADLQSLRGAGIGPIYSRVLTHQEFVEDCTETIRLGLIGGGLDPIEARRLVDLHAGDDMIHESRWALAAAILSACIFGYEPDAKRKKKAPVTTTDGSI